MFVARGPCDLKGAQTRGPRCGEGAAGTTRGNGHGTGGTHPSPGGPGRRGRVGPSCPAAAAREMSAGGRGAACGSLSGAEDLGGRSERLEIGNSRSAVAVLARAADGGGDRALVTATLRGEHAEAELVLYPLGERPQLTRGGEVVVAHGDACEAGEAVGAMPHVLFFDAEAERLPVGPGGVGKLALVE